MKNMTSVIAMAGPRRELSKIRLGELFGKVIKFDCPDDHGEFPDLGAYESRCIDEDGNEIISHDWQKFEANMEDSQLYPYMLKCVDAVTEFLTKRAETLEKLNFINIMTTMNGHKFGGKVFAIAGFVTYECLPIGRTPMGKGIIIAQN